MLSFLVAISSAAAYNVSAIANVSTSTEVVSAYTTYCPHPTTFVEGSSTYTVSEATTLTITDCPCTRTHTFSTATVTVCPSKQTSSNGVAVAGPTNTKVSAPSVANGAIKQGVSFAAAAGAIVAAGLL